MERKLRVLHITPDNKFFDRVFLAWEKNEDFENNALFYTPQKNYQFLYIKRTDVLEIYYRKRDVRERLQRDDYDVVYLHSMPSRFYQFVTWIPVNRKVIWWGWGYDIYSSQRGLPPIIKINLYKEKTQQFVNKSHIGIIRWLKHHLVRMYAKNLQEKVLRRIDYYQPVIKAEMEQMSQVAFFRAGEFYSKPGAPVFNEFEERPTDGDIKLGNSATAYNNHLDVLDVILGLKQKGQKIIMPLSYGNERYKVWLKPYLKHLDLRPIYNFMAYDEYFQMVGQCSYAIYGTIRQQAMGNINYDISHGIKVFLYRDSVAYKDLRNRGYVVFPIEEMTEESLRTPLTREQMEQNNNARLVERNRRMMVYQQFIKEVSTQMNS